MRKNILVIGGTRYFGKLLVQRLLQAGHSVTIATRGLAPDPFGDRIARIRVDRRNENAMRAAFANIAGYDIVYDQMCYNPIDAAISARVFARQGQTLRDGLDHRRLPPAAGQPGRPVRRIAVNVLASRSTRAIRGTIPHLACESYVMGKVQAEAYFYRDGSLPVVSVRIGHVLAGAEDFTGRLAHYVDLVRQGAPLRYSNAAAASSFMSVQTVTDFLVWTGMQTSPARSTPPATARCPPSTCTSASAWRSTSRSRRSRSARRRAGRTESVRLPGAADGRHQPRRALGYRFGHSDEWLDNLIRQHDLAFV